MSTKLLAICIEINNFGANSRVNKQHRCKHTRHVPIDREENTFENLKKARLNEILFRQASGFKYLMRDETEIYIK